MLPAAWMVLTYVITIPFGTKASLFPCVTPYFIRGFHDIRHRVAYLDRILTLDSSVWLHVCNVKANYLFQTLVPPACDSEVWMGRPVGLLAFCKPIILQVLSTPLDDFWMTVEFRAPTAHLPSHSHKLLTHLFLQTIPALSCFSTTDLRLVNQ